MTTGSGLGLRRFWAGPEVLERFAPSTRSCLGCGACLVRGFGSQPQSSFGIQVHATCVPGPAGRPSRRRRWDDRTDRLTKILSALQSRCWWQPLHLRCFSYCAAVVEADHLDTQGWAWDSLPSKRWDSGPFPRAALSPGCARELAGAVIGLLVPLEQVQGRLPKESAAARQRWKICASCGCTPSCCSSPPRTGC